MRFWAASSRAAPRFLSAITGNATQARVIDPMPKVAKRKPVPARRNACSRLRAIPFGAGATPGRADRSAPLQANRSTSLLSRSGGFRRAGRGFRLPRSERRCQPLVGLSRFATAFIALAGAAASESTSPGLDFESLLRDFAATPGLEAQFREEKHLTLLRAPLESDGRLYFAPPDKLARHVLHPSPSVIVVRGRTITVDDDTGSRSIDLAEAPIASAFVDSLRMLLTGDLAALRSEHEVDFSVPSKSAPRAWTLQLRPRKQPLLGVIDRIEIAGTDTTLAEVHVFETAGDHTRVRFANVDASHEFSPVELDQAFPRPSP